MIRWFTDEGSVPEAVECDADWPTPDVKGRPQYENTHFATEDEAWVHAIGDAESMLEFSAASITAAKQRVSEDERRVEHAEARHAEDQQRLDTLRRIKARLDLGRSDAFSPELAQAWVGYMPSDSHRITEQEL